MLCQIFFIFQFIMLGSQMLIYSYKINPLNMVNTEHILPLEIESQRIQQGHRASVHLFENIINVQFPNLRRTDRLVACMDVTSENTEVNTKLQYRYKSISNLPAWKNLVSKPNECFMAFQSLELIRGSLDTQEPIKFLAEQHSDSSNQNLVVKQNPENEITSWKANVCFFTRATLKNVLVNPQPASNPKKLVRLQI